MDEDEIERVIRKLLLLRGAGNSVSSEEVARVVGTTHGKAWRPLVKPVREVAVRMAGDGYIVIRKKGKAVDPVKLKGAYRIALPPPGPPQRPVSNAGDDNGADG